MDTNETTPEGTGTDPAADPTAQQAPQQDQPRPAGEGFFNWLRGLGVSRPNERWFGGVAAGIAERAGIDPLIVRGIFVALAIVGGPGILLYAIGWFLLPDARGRIEAEQLFRGNSNGTSITLAVVIGLFVISPIFTGVGGLFTGGIGGWGVWGVLGMPEWLIVLFTVLWWLVLSAAVVWITLLIIARRNSHLSREEAEQRAAEWGNRFGQRATEWGNQVGDKATQWGNSFSEKASTWGQPTEQPDTAQAPGTAGAASAQPSHWGAQAGASVAGVAAQVNDWTARDIAEHRRTRLDPAHTILTLGVALLAAGAAAALAVTAGAAPLLAGIVAAVAVLGLSLIVAGLRGRRSGWIGFWSFAGVVAMLWVAFIPANTQFVPFGDIDTRVTSLESGTRAGVGLLAGDSTVDLRGLDETGGILDVWVVAGTAEILLPDRTIPVRVEARTLAGQQITIDRAGNETRLSSPLLAQTTGIAARPGDSTPVTTVRVWMLAGNTTIDGVSAQSITSDTAATATASARELSATMILEDAR